MFSQEEIGYPNDMVKDNFVVIIPAFNEGKYIGKVVDLVRKYASNIIVVDDGSTDDTNDRLKNKKIYLVRHVINLGKGDALRTGVEYAKRLGFEKVIFMDSDGQHDAKLIGEFIAKLKCCDVVFGTRNLSLKKGGLRFIGNKINSTLISILFNTKFPDPLCGFRAFNLHVYPSLLWESSGYGVETEMVIRVIRNKISYDTVSVPLIYLDKYKGVSILEGYKVFIDMLKWRLLI